MSFIPNDNIGCTDVVVSRPTGEKSVDDGWEVFEVLKDKFRLITCSVYIFRRKKGQHTTDVGGGNGGWGRRPLPRRELLGRILL